MGRFRLPLAFVLVNGLLLAPGWTIVGELRPPWLTGEAALLVPLLFFLPPSLPTYVRHGARKELE